MSVSDERDRTQPQLRVMLRQWRLVQAPEERCSPTARAPALVQGREFSVIDGCRLPAKRRMRVPLDPEKMSQAPARCKCCKTCHDSMKAEFSILLGTLAGSPSRSGEANRICPSCSLKHALLNRSSHCLARQAEPSNGAYRVQLWQSATPKT